MSTMSPPPAGQSLSSAVASSSLILDRIRGEFREMPGLSLTLEQARRLWSLDAPTCSEALSYLAEAGFLCRKPNGTYARLSNPSDRPLNVAKWAVGISDVKRPA